MVIQVSCLRFQGKPSFKAMAAFVFGFRIYEC